MALFLKNIAPELYIFGNRQLFNFNKDASSGESNSALSLINWFTPISNVNANSTFEFLTPTMKGFRLNHSLSTTGTFGNFNFEKYDRFGTAVPLWGYNEVTDSFVFFKNVSLSITGGLDLTSNKITNLGVAILSTDAVNKGQMDTANAATLTLAQTFTNNKTWTASQITDFVTQVRINKLNEMSVPNSSVNMNGFNILSVAMPVNPYDAATKKYVDDVAAQLTSSINMISLQTAPQSNLVQVNSPFGGASYNNQSTIQNWYDSYNGSASPDTPSPGNTYSALTNAGEGYHIWCGANNWYYSTASFGSPWLSMGPFAGGRGDFGAPILSIARGR